MKLQLPKKEYTGNRTCRKETCAPGPDRGSPRTQENDEVHGTEQHAPGKKSLSVPLQKKFSRIILRETFLQKTRAAYRKTRGRPLKNVPNSGPAIRTIFFGGPPGNFFCPRGDQQDSFRSNGMFSLAGPVPRFDEPFFRPGPCGPETGDGQPVQDRGRTDRPDKIGAGRDQQ